MTGQSAALRPDNPAPDRVGAAITLTDVTKRFATAQAVLQGIDLQITGGEFFTLLGPSGCGKTTLLRLIAGLEDISRGTIHIGERDVTQMPAHKRSVNTVFQSYALFQHLNVADNIGFGLKMRRLPKHQIRQRVAEVARFIKIDALLSRGVDQLSGGQRQRVALARALVNKPDVLLLDEPLSALDADLRGELQLELSRIQRRLGMTFVFVTHDQQEAMVMSDRIAVMEAGRIQQLGTPQQIYEYPNCRFVAQFMGHRNLFAIQRHHDQGVALAFGWVHGHFARGDYVLIRPETMQINWPEQLAGHDNVFAAVVQERVYRGHVAEYTVQLSEETTIMVTRNNQGQAMFDIGARVAISVPASGVVALHA